MLKSRRVDVPDLQFKLQCRLKVFENTELSAFPTTYNLVTCASRYGLFFVGTNSNSFQVIKTQDIHSYTPKDKDVSDYPRRTIEIASPPKHLCVNCDSTRLAVVIDKDHCPVVLFYEVLSFYKKDIKLIKEIRLSATPNVYVKEINWNPSLPGIFTACKSDGSLGVYELKEDSIDINELPPASGSTSFSWSPKGKQLIVGSINGKITQYKPDLKAVRVIKEPQLPGQHSVICLQWVANYQFIGVYQSAESSSIFVIDAPKVGEPVFTNYDDICYSGSLRQPQFYFIFEQQWNILMVASANSTEVGVLGNVNETWTPWLMQDEARAELPLSSDHQETLPVGLGFDVSSTDPLPWDQGTIPPCPLLLLLSHHGVLCCFNVVNLKKDIPSLCTAPDNISDTSGLPYFVKKQELSGNKYHEIPTVGTKSSFPVGQENAQLPSLFHQNTITPVKPQQQMQLFGGQATITPIKSTQPVKHFEETALSKSTPNTSAEKYTAIFSALQTTASGPPQEKSIVISPKVDTTQGQPKSNTKPTTPTTATAKVEEQTVDPRLKAVTHTILTQAIKDETVYLESELKAILHQSRSLKVSIGTEEDKSWMVKQLDSLQDFIKELTDICVGQGSEVHCLKQNLIQAWALFEEARSHYNTAKNEAVTLLLKSRPLDSLSEKRKNDIKQSVYYIESQLSQANKALDEQWNNFQDYAKKTHRIHMPTMETIFQTMVRQNAVMEKQAYILKDISMRLRKKTPATSLALLCLDEKPDFLTDEMSALHLNPKDVIQLHYGKILNDLKHLSVSKTNKLRNLLNKREVAHVTAVKPQLSNWTMNQSPMSRTKEMISLLGAHMSPVPKTAVARNLDFNQSTPIRTIEPATTVTLNKEQTSNPVILAKSGSLIGTKQGSAFVPTTQMKSSLMVSTATSASTMAFSDKTSTSKMPASTLFSFGGAEIKSGSSMQTSTPSMGFTFNSTSMPKPTVTADPFKNSLPPHTSTDATPNVKFSATSLFTPTSSFSNLGFVSKTTSSNSTKVSTTPAASNNFNISKTQTSSEGFTPIANAPSSLFSKVAAESKKTDEFTNKVPTFATTSIFAKPTSGLKLSSPKDGEQAISSCDNTALTSTSKLAIGQVLTPTTLFSSASDVASEAVALVSKPTEIASTVSTNTATQPNSVTALEGVKICSPLSSNKAVTSSSSIFGGAASTPLNFSITSVLNPLTPVSTSTDSSNAPSPSASIFGAPTISASNKFSSSATSASDSLVSSAAMTSGIFSTSTSAGTSSIFGAAPTFSAPSNIFAATTSSPGVFGAATTSSPSSPAIFAAASSGFGSSTTSANVFGVNATVATPSTIFGTTSSEPITSTTAASSSVFGAIISTSPNIGAASSVASTTTVTSSTVFGGVIASGSTPSAVCRSAQSEHGAGIPSTSASVLEAVTTSGPSTVFGTESVATLPGVFGTATTSAPATNIFATSSSSGATTTANIFGTSTPSVFGTTTSSSNIFSGASNSSSIFGAPASTSQSNSIFSGPAKSTGSIFSQPSFGTQSIFGSGQSPPTSSAFGAPQSTPSIFGNAQAAPVFGAPQTTNTASGFGSPQSTSAASIFGSAQSTNVSSVFGSTTQATTATSSVFGQTVFGATTTSSFGSGSQTSTFGSGFGGSNTFGSPSPQNSQTPGSFGFGNLNVGSASPSSGSIFGGSSSFGQTAATPNPFAKAGGGTNIFANPASTAPTNVFGTPTSTSNSIFGSGTGTTFGSGFGATSTFGSSSFGQNSSFGQGAFGNTSFGGVQSGPFSTPTASPIAQSGFGAAPAFQKPSGFGSPPSFGGSPAPAFGGAPSFGGSPTFGSTATFGSPEKVFGAQTASFGTPAAQQNTGFGNLANQNTIGFGNLAQQANNQSSLPFSGGGSSSFSSWR